VGVVSLRIAFDCRRSVRTMVMTAGVSSRGLLSMSMSLVFKIDFGVVA
jgi:hypothetical protein